MVCSPFSGEKTGKLIDFEIRYCNPAAIHSFEVPSVEVLGGSLLKTPLFDEDIRLSMFEHCLQVWATGDNQEFTWHTSKLDRYFNLQYRRLLEGVLTIIHDCTGEVKAEVKRQEQERKFQLILDSSGDGVMMLDAIRDVHNNVVDFRVSFCNRCGYTMAKLPPDAVGRSLFTLLPHLRNHEQLELHKQVLDNGETIRFETTFRNQEGEEYGWFIVSLTKVGDGLISRYTDITQRKQYEEQIARQKEELQSILDASINGVMSCEAVRETDGSITDLLIRRVNAAFSKITGVEGDEAEGKLFLSLFPFAKESGIFDAYCQVIKTGTSLRREMLYQGQGINAWLDISAVKKGREEVVVSLIDISAEKEVQHQLESTVENLRRSNKSLEEFAFAASHDLQEPLRKIQVFNDHLKIALTAKADTSQLAMFERIDASANRMRLLIDNVMAYSHVSRPDGEYEQVELGNLVQEVVRDLETAIKEKEAVLTISSLPFIRGNKIQLYQLFQNIISNSLTYVAKGKKPHITIFSKKVTGRQVAMIVGEGNALNSYHVIELTDNGIGFEMKFAQRIFQVFQRLHGNAEFAGTGIGLAIVQKVVENQSGFVVAESKPGVGTTLRVLLPA